MYFPEPTGYLRAEEKEGLAKICSWQVASGFEPRYARGIAVKTKSKKILSRLLLFLIFFKGVHCAHKEINKGWDTATPAPWTGAPSSQAWTVMAYNVENLFDTVHDEGKEDYTFLPLSSKKTKEVQEYCAKQSSNFRRKECVFTDWTEELLVKKMKSISGVILQAGGRGPDVLILSEVENLSVLKRLNREHLKDSGYITEVLVEGDDSRGIDVGILSRFPLAGPPQIHRYGEKTRGILEAQLILPDTLGKQKLTVFGFHFPSQSNPSEKRVDAIMKLSKVIAEAKKHGAVVAGGDGNITTEENRKFRLFERLEEHGVVSHRWACDRCVGTHNYKGKWDYLDWIFFSQDLIDGGKFLVDKNSISTPNRAPGQLLSSGLPDRFDFETGNGIADHLPIFAEIKMVPKTTK